MWKSTAQNQSTVQRDGLPRQFAAPPLVSGRDGYSLPCLSDELLILCARIDFNP
jgi:hypothetical protein